MELERKRGDEGFGERQSSCIASMGQRERAEGFRLALCRPFSEFTGESSSFGGASESAHFFVIESDAQVSLNTNFVKIYFLKFIRQ